MSWEEGPTGVMRREHEQSRSLVETLALNARDPARWTETAKTLSALVRQHLGKENRFLFPMAEFTLTDGAKQDLWSVFQRIQDQHLNAGRFQQFADHLRELEPASMACRDIHQPIRHC